MKGNRTFQNELCHRGSSYYIVSWLVVWVGSTAWCSQLSYWFSNPLFACYGTQL